MTALERPAQNLTLETIDQEAVMRHLGLNPRDAATQALLLTCQKYSLDPILKHALLIQGRLYVTRDGLLHVAHRSGVFDGMEVLEQGETPTHHTAKVSVWRKDMARPFTYIGRHPKGKKGPASEYGPEMAVKVAEVMALRRAFDVALCAAEERWDEDAQQAQRPARAPVTQEAQNDPAHVQLVQKIGNNAAKIRSRYPDAAPNVEVILSRYQYREDAAQAQECSAEIIALAKELHAHKQQQAQPTEDVVGAELVQEAAAPAPEPVTAAQRQGLGAHSKRAGAESSEDRARLWGLLLNSEHGRPTKELTAEEAGILLDMCAGFSNSELVQALSDAREKVLAI